MAVKFMFIFLFVFSTSGFAFAQSKPVKKDSTKIYTEIEDYSKRSKFTRLMYGLVFNPSAADPANKKAQKKKYKKLIRRPYSAFKGKIIRHIEIETLDPFGFSIADTIQLKQNLLNRTGNKLHLKSQEITIRNLLLIRKNQPFDSLLVKESERLVRTRGYIRDVSFFVKRASGSADSVDIFIRSLDRWSIIPRGSISSSKVSVGFTENNFLGLGHQFKNDYTRNNTLQTNSFQTDYSIPNIKNTYISSNLHYGTDRNIYSSRSLSFDRPFFSPFAKWAAGVIFIHQFVNDSIPDSNSELVHLQFKYNAQDYWAGYAMRIFKGNSEYNRTTNFITATRFFRIRYLEKPSQSIDEQHYFSDENLYLASIGISTRRYVQDKYIFKFGITEDVPIGKVYSITGGYQMKNNIGRTYFGARGSSGNYYSWGYLSTSVEFGGFYKNSHLEEGVVTTGINYFSGLFELGQWKIRQFVNPQITIGINRLKLDSLTLNEGAGIDGFYTTKLRGTSRILINLQTQSYAPWNFIGFRFGPYFSYSLGMLGDADTGFKGSKVYSRIGIGVLIKNENLVLNTFQISISFYPEIPGHGYNIFKINSYSTADFGLRDFEIGKPEPVVFR